MPNFESGVHHFIHVEATVCMHFPVDLRGRADVSCNQCEFLRRSSKSCALNGRIVQYPEHYVGADCPFLPYLEAISAADESEKENEP